MSTPVNRHIKSLPQWLKEAAKKCQPVILEPIMKIEVTVPEQYYGDCIGISTSRRGSTDW